MYKEYKLFLANLDSEVTEEDLRETFAKIGELGAVFIIPDKRIAFVSYKERKDAELALKTFRGFEYFGQKMFVDWARPKRRVRQKQAS